MDNPPRNRPSGVSNISKGNLSRVEQFENEKKRIIESCFSKREEDGSISESYITHLRIEEDAAFPSSPAPPNANPDSKKYRTIVVAVRKTGRVRVHKARENANGTFSIGKTWILDDLTAVQSYTGSAPSGGDSEQHKLWAGNTGFTVTLGKPYYWKANSQKEKQFFIASLVKIYHKYTGGSLPDMIGFDQKERDQLSGIATPSRPPPISTQSFSQGQLQTRDTRQNLSQRNDNNENPGQATPTSPNGKLPVSKNQTRLQPGPTSSGSNSSYQLSGSSRLPPSFKRLPSNQSQRSFNQNEEENIESTSRANQDESSDTAEKSPNPQLRANAQGIPTSDSTPFRGRSAGEAQADSPQMPAPLSINSEVRRPSISAMNNSRENLPNSNENISAATLSSPTLRKEEKYHVSRNEKTHSTGPSASNTSLILTDNASTSSPKKGDAFKSSTNKVSNQSQSSSITTEIPLQGEHRSGISSNIFKSKSKSKSDDSGIFSGAATAISNLKPRIGGTADQPKDSKQKLSDTIEGYTGAGPISGFLRLPGYGNLLSKSPKVPDPKPRVDEEIPEIRLNTAPSKLVSEELPPTPSDTDSHENSHFLENKKSKAPTEKIAKDLATIGVDPIILGGRGGDLICAWEQFGWSGEGIRTKSVDRMKEEVERELCRIQAGGWLSRLEEEDERIEAIKTGFNKVINECDELDGLLTLYLVELGTLNEDVAYIEAQSQGLQVHTANQKLLQTEVQSLLQTISISSKQLESLRESSLESNRGLSDIETSLVILYKAMLTIDPSLGISGPKRSEDGSANSEKPGVYGNNEIGSMQVLQEKKEVYRNEIAVFMRRLKPFLEVKFSAAFDQVRHTLEKEKSNSLARSPGRTKLDTTKHELARNLLWKYAPLMLFAREVDRKEWENLIKMYESVSRPVYQEEFQVAIVASKFAARKFIGEETDVIFTSQVEKQAEGLASTARKLTVKKSQNLAKSLRSPIGDNNTKTSFDKSLGVEPYEVTEEAISKMVSVISMEQNFFVDFFHVTSLEQYDFLDTIAASAPDDRRGIDIRRPRVMDPNRDMAMLVVQSMEEIYSFFPKEIAGLVDWSLQSDPLQSVGIIAALERKIPEYEETNQEYLNRTLQKLHTQLIGTFIKFLDDQIRVIEETKVKIKKRKGVIGFIRTFPAFSNALERKLIAANGLEIRSTINNAYSRINKAMFEALKVIARDNPSAQIAVSDPADKEALNYEILLMQNMHHYIEEVDTRMNQVLEEWKQNAINEMDEHMTLYLGAVIRRPLGKLLTFLESAESMMLSRQPGEQISKISGMPSHSESTFKKVLADYDSKEIKRGIESLKKRVEKHFGEEHDAGTASGNSLVVRVLQGCEKYYEDVEGRILTISRDVYNGAIAAEWTRADVSAAFKK